MDLVLYMFDTCPYCQRVIDEIKSQKRTDIDFKNIQQNEENRNRLIEIGGKSQVPCLVIEGKPLYESADIIEWLRSNPQIT